jgi:hypothetical protein
MKGFLLLIPGFLFGSIHYTELSYNSSLEEDKLFINMAGIWSSSTILFSAVLLTMAVVFLFRKIYVSVKRF